MFYKIFKIENLASVAGRDTSGMVYVEVGFGHSANQAASQPFLIEDFHMQIAPRVITEGGVDAGENPVDAAIVENIERHIQQVAATGRTGDRRHPEALRNAADPMGIIRRPAVQELIGVVRQK